MENIKIARVLLKIAKYLEAEYEYKSDPEHKHKPKGGGWKETEQGWSRSDNSIQKMDSSSSSSDSTSNNEVKPEEYGNVDAPIRKAIKKFRETFKEIPKSVSINLFASKTKFNDTMEQLDKKDKEFETAKKSPNWNLMTPEQQEVSEMKAKALTTLGRLDAFKDFCTSNLKALHVKKDRIGRINASICTPHKIFEDYINAGLRAINCIIDKDIIPQAEVTFFTQDDCKEGEGRSCYNEGKLKDGTEIKVIVLKDDQQFDISAMAHEMGHFIEGNSPGVKELCQEFLNARTDGEEPQNLNKIYGQKYFSEDETCRPDHFPDPYCGKIYKDGGTEILSKGIELLAQDPIEFYEKDPEYFCFVLAILHGELKNYKKEDYQ